MKTILFTVLLLGASFANADVSSSLTKLGNVIQNNVPEKNRGPLIEAYNKVVDELNKLQCVSDGSANQKKRSDCEIKRDIFGNFIVSQNEIAISQYSYPNILDAKADFDNLVRAGVCINGTIASECKVEKDMFGNYIVKRLGSVASQFSYPNILDATTVRNDMKQAGLCN